MSIIRREDEYPDEPEEDHTDLEELLWDDPDDPGLDEEDDFVSDVGPYLDDEEEPLESEDNEEP